MFGHSVVSDSWWPHRQAHLSMGFSRQEYWSGLPFPTPGDLPDPGIEPVTPHWQTISLPLSYLGSPYIFYIQPKHYRRYISRTIVNSSILTFGRESRIYLFLNIQRKEAKPVSYEIPGVHQLQSGEGQLSQSLSGAEIFHHGWYIQRAYF